jgi:DNA-binding MarR family transcriptional regulator
MAARQGRTPSAPARVSGVAWATDLIRLEIAVWERVDARLRAAHELPLSFFESLLFISRAPGASMRVGDLARALRVTVGGTSKLVDRIERAGLLAREADPDDRRASRLVLTTTGKRKVTAALKTYDAEVAALLDGVLDPDEQRRMSEHVSRLLASIDEGETASRL